jgi:hypothetical protein
MPSRYILVSKKPSSSKLTRSLLATLVTDYSDELGIEVRCSSYGVKTFFTHPLSNDLEGLHNIKISEAYT